MAIRAETKTDRQIKSLIKRAKLGDVDSLKELRKFAVIACQESPREAFLEIIEQIQRIKTSLQGESAMGADKKQIATVAQD
jgi:hypothetical protein